MGRKTQTDDETTQTTLTDALLATDGGVEDDEPDEEEPEDELDALASSISDAGPEDARTILPTAQSETLVARDLRGWSRNDTAEALDVSVYTVDDRLRRARQNSEAVAATARVLVDLGVLDAEDLGVEPEVREVEVESDTSDEREVLLLGGTPVPERTEGLAEDVLDEVAAGVRQTLDDEVLVDAENGDRLGTLVLDGNTWEFDPADLSESDESVEDGARDDADENATEDREEDSDLSPTAWGRLMALDAVTKVSRSRDGGAATVSLKEADEDEVEAVEESLREAGLAPFSTQSLASSGEYQVRAKRPAEPDEPTEDLSEFEDDEPEPRDLDDDLDSVVRRVSPVEDRLGRFDAQETESGATDDATEETTDGSDEETDDESDGEEYVCDDCGRGFSTPGGLGGHRRYCEERQERLAAESDE